MYIWLFRPTKYKGYIHDCLQQQELFVGYHIFLWIISHLQLIGKSCQIYGMFISNMWQEPKQLSLYMASLVTFQSNSAEVGSIRFPDILFNFLWFLETISKFCHILCSFVAPDQQQFLPHTFLKCFLQGYFFFSLSLSILESHLKFTRWMHHTSQLTIGVIQSSILTKWLSHWRRCCKYIHTCLYH